jgi:hypothetical protein
MTGKEHDQCLNHPFQEIADLIAERKRKNAYLYPFHTLKGPHPDYGGRLSWLEYYEQEFKDENLFHELNSKVTRALEAVKQALGVDPEVNIRNLSREGKDPRHNLLVWSIPSGRTTEIHDGGVTYYYWPKVEIDVHGNYFHIEVDEAEKSSENLSENELINTLSRALKSYFGIEDN